ncbi:unnamed protein product [Gadus morhua 'NCC']
MTTNTGVHLVFLWLKRASQCGEVVAAASDHRYMRSAALPSQRMLPLTPALPPAPVGEEAVSEGDAASPPTAKDAGTTSDEDVNYDINNDWPDLWTAKQKEDFKCKNPWLGSKNKKMG